MDIACAKCREPWDSYGVRNGDMTDNEAERFLRGEGCPACGFGTTCVACSGTGLEKETFAACACFGDHFRVARFIPDDGRLWQFRPGLEARRIETGKPAPARFMIHLGYVPNVVTLPPDVRPEVLKVYGPEQALEGWYVSVKIRCPEPHPAAAPCPECNGSGKFVPRHPDRQEMFAAAVELLGDDQDGLTATLEDLTD